MSSIEISPVSPQETRIALRVTLATRNQSAADLERHVSAFLEYARAMSFDLSRQWLCRRRGRIETACTCIESPGRTAMLLLPFGSDPSVDAVTLRRVIEHVIEQESSRDIRLLQALIEPDDERCCAALRAAGFRQIAVLHYMELQLGESSAARDANLPASLSDMSPEWIQYGPEVHDEFAGLISATYQEGLDCPGLCELREIEDVIAGHRAAGHFEPHRWRLLRCNEEPAACILFAENPLRPILELVYMGVHPRYRGKSIGRHVLDTGLQFAYHEHYQTVTLAVDAGNHPAVSLYDRAGFRRTHRRRAMIRPIVLSSDNT